MKSITRTVAAFCLVLHSVCSRILKRSPIREPGGLGYGGRRGEGCVGCDGGGRKVDSSTGILSISLSMNSTEVQSATLEYKRV